MAGRRSLQPPGSLIDVGGFRLHLHAAGPAAPVVVFDAALGGSSVSWTYVQRDVVTFARAVTYDRAGFGWSDAGPLPRTAGRIAEELHTLLHAAGERPPYVLVGHSFGGLVMRIFAQRYPDRDGRARAGRSRASRGLGASSAERTGVGRSRRGAVPAGHAHRQVRLRARHRRTCGHGRARAGARAGAARHRRQSLQP